MGGIPFDPPPAPLDHRGCLATDTPCIRCDYNLRGLEVGATCPECGLAVKRSLHGHLIAHGDPNWVGLLTRGVGWLIVGSTTELMVAFLGMVAFPPGGHPPGYPFAMFRALASAMPVFSLVPPLVLAVGTWYVTALDPVGKRDPTLRGPRWTARAAAAARIAVEAVASASAIAGPVTLMGLVTLIEIAILAAVACWLYWILSLGQILRRLALRLPDRSLGIRLAVVVAGYAPGVVALALAAAATRVLAPSHQGGPPVECVVFIFALVVIGFAVGFIILLTWLRNALSYAGYAAWAEGAGARRD